MRAGASIGIALFSTTLGLGCGDDAPITGDGSSDDSTAGTADTSTPLTMTVTTSPSTSADSTADVTATSNTETTVATVATEPLDTSGSSTTGDPLPEIEVSIEGVVVADGSSHDLSQTVDVGAAGAPVEVVIENVGTADLSLAGASVTAGDTAHFVVDTAALDPVVAPGGSTSLTVTFTPGNGGLKGLALAIDSDDADESPYDVELRAHSTPNTFREITPALSPTPRFNAAMADMHDGRLLMFGGRLGNGIRLDDEWIYDVEAGTWSIEGPAVAPTVRDAHRMVHAGSDTIVLFGGNTQNFGGPTVIYDDTWAFDVVTETWMDLAPPAPPPGRFQHGMVAIADDTVLIFGGRIQFGVHLGDTWIYDAITNTWTDVAPAGGIGPRSAAAMGFDGAGTATVFGGYAQPTVPDVPLDETWSYDVAANAWTQGAPVSTPGARMALLGAYFETGAFIVTSGKLGSCCVDPSPGTFAYDPVADDWTDLAPAVEPTPRFNYALAYVEGANKAIIFGGLSTNLDQASTTQETWEYVGPWP